MCIRDRYSNTVGFTLWWPSRFSDDIEKVTESDIFPQKRLFSFLHSKKIPEVPQTDDERKIYPLFHTNIFSNMFFWWVLPILRVGYKRTIQPNDLFKMDPRMSIETLYGDFEQNMIYYFEKTRKKYHKSHPEATEEEVTENAKLPNHTVLKALLSVSYTHLDVYKRQPLFSHP